MTVEAMGSSPVAGFPGAELGLLRVTIGPGASLPGDDDVASAVMVVESGRVALEVGRGEVEVTLSGERGRFALSPGETVTLAPGDAVSYGAGSSVTTHNAADGETTILLALLADAGEPLFGDAQGGSFSVETYACPAGMTLATLDPDACKLPGEPLVRWSLASAELVAPLGAEAATIAGARTTWDGLPGGTYFVDVTAESFASGYGDYFIPSSSQVTRQDERTTRIYFDAAVSRGVIRAYVFPGEPASDEGAGA